MVLSKEFVSLVDSEEEVHVLSFPSMLPVGAGLDVCSSELLCLDPIGAEDLPVDRGELVPLIIEFPGVEWVAGASSLNWVIHEGIAPVSVSGF